MLDKRQSHFNSLWNLFFYRYVVFYLPFDVGFKVLKFLPIKMACEALREILR